MKVLVTGGAGYLGSQLVKGLARCQDVTSIVIYDNLSRRNMNLFLGDQLPANKLTLMCKDILDSRSLRQAVSSSDVVFHLAAKVTTPYAEQDAHQFEQINHWGTAELSYAIESANVKKVIYVSSTSVYGSRDDETVDENSPLVPITAYGVSKARGEEYLQRLDLPVYVIRCANVYGYSRSMRFDSVINKFAFESNYLGRVRIAGRGVQYRPFVHVDVAASALERVLFADLEPKTYNLVQRNLSIMDIFATLKELKPHLEYTSIDQQFLARSLRVKPTAELITSPADDLAGFSDEMAMFLDKMAF